MNQSRKLQFLATGGPTSAQTTTAVIDTLGIDFVSVGLAFSTVAQTTPEITIAIGEGDTTSAYTNITELVGGGVGGFTIPAPPTNTSVANTLQFDIDTRTRKRYLQLSVTPFTTKTVYIFACNGRPDVGPPAATSDNLMARIAV